MGSLESGILSRSFPIHGISLQGILRFPSEVDIVGILVLLNVIASVSEKAGQLVRQIYDSWTYHKGVKSQILYNLHGTCNLCCCKKHGLSCTELCRCNYELCENQTTCIKGRSDMSEDEDDKFSD